MAGDPMRLTQSQDCKFLRVRDGLPVNLIDGATVEFEVTRHCQCVGPRLTRRLACVALLQRSELIDMIQQCLGNAQQQAAAGCRRHIAPVTFKGMSRSLDGTPGLRAARARDMSEHVAGRGVQDLYRSPVVSSRPFVVDEVHVRCRSFSFGVRPPGDGLMKTMGCPDGIY